MQAASPAPQSLSDKLGTCQLGDVTDDGEALNDIGLTLQRADHIRACEARRRELEPWLFT